MSLTTDSLDTFLSITISFKEKFNRKYLLAFYLKQYTFG
jgi:hypothetical protein